jgi:hypothetical protein
MNEKRKIESLERETISVLQEDGKALINQRIQSPRLPSSSSPLYTPAKAAAVILLLGVLGLLGGFIGNKVHTRKIVETEMEYLVESIMTQHEKKDTTLLAINADPHEEMARFVEELWKPADSLLKRE